MDDSLPIEVHGSPSGSASPAPARRDPGLPGAHARPGRAPGTGPGQLPPGRGPDRADDLAGFLDAWPHELDPLAVEARHPAWFGLEQLDTLLAERGAARAIHDSRAIHAGGPGALSSGPRRKPDLPVLPTAPGPLALVRFIAPPHVERSRPWMREGIASPLRWLEEDRDVDLFVH